VNTWEWIAAISAVAIGACAQGSIGFGLGVVAAPVLAIVDPDLIPGPLLLVAMVLTTLVMLRERGGIDWRGMKWAIVGRVPGSVLGTALVVVLSERLLIISFSLLVIAGVIMSIAGWKVSPTSSTLFTAGAASGLMGSITSIGGPPMGIVYQRSSGAELRSTLSGFFVFGSTLSVALLIVSGEMHMVDLRRAMVLVPAMLVGYVSSRWVGQYLDRGYLRMTMLGFSGITCLAVLLLQVFNV
jgi:uncharacterized protein